MSKAKYPPCVCGHSRADHGGIWACGVNHCQCSRYCPEMPKKEVGHKDFWDAQMRETKQQAKRGWAIEITRKDGSTFLAHSGNGIMPAIYAWSMRKYAAKFRKELLVYGFRPCKVVPVLYFEPITVRKNPLRNEIGQAEWSGRVGSRQVRE